MTTKGFGTQSVSTHRMAKLSQLNFSVCWAVRCSLSNWAEIITEARIPSFQDATPT